MSFSDLAALEAKSQNQAYKPNAHPTSDPNSHFEDPTGRTAVREHKVKTFVVKCHEDSIEVVMKAYLFGHRLPFEPKHLRLGPVSNSQDHCTATRSGSGDYTIRAALSECGTKLMVTESAVLYNNLLLFTPPPPLPGSIFQAVGVAIPVQCEYGRRYRVSSRALRPTWSPLISTQSTHHDLDFHLRLMTDDWSNESQSSVYFLGDMVNIEASVDVANHLPLRLYVDSCVATLTADVNSNPRYPFIDHQGCFTDSQLTGSRSRFLPRVQDKLLQIQLEPFLFHQDHRHTVSTDSKMWRSVDGDDSVCESCGHTSRAKPAAYPSSHKRALRSKTKYTRNVCGGGCRRHLDLSSISLLGPDGPCAPVGITAVYAIYQFHVKDCGTQMQVSPLLPQAPSPLHAHCGLELDVGTLAALLLSIKRDRMSRSLADPLFSGPSFVLEVENGLVCARQLKEYHGLPASPSERHGP
ncbi:zona pellucida sperm-binding protein 3-like [Centroberyx affinis]|uniref:zona pellucida sperm-binding protein 3-like n=1 Tax=Centroberyx affinis TaxID=166261 RepID=UPI003A5BDBBE